MIIEKEDDILTLLQIINDYSEEYIKKLVDDASSTDCWTNDRFQIWGSKINFRALKRKDDEAHKRVLQHIVSKMDNVEGITYERLSTLYNFANI